MPFMLFIKKLKTPQPRSRSTAKYYYHNMLIKTLNFQTQQQKRAFFVIFVQPIFKIKKKWNFNSRISVLPNTTLCGIYYQNSKQQWTIKKQLSQQ